MNDLRFARRQLRKNPLFIGVFLFAIEIGTGIVRPSAAAEESSANPPFSIQQHNGMSWLVRPN